MKNKIRAFICPHIDDEYSLCQDRFFIDSEKSFFAVSDGVSSSFSPTYYAEIISSYNENDNVSISKEDARVIFAKWQGYIEGLLAKEKLGRASRQRFQRGETPSATYARLKMYDFDNTFKWDCAVLGDCSIIHAHRKGEILKVEHAILSGEKFKSDKYVYNSETDYYRFGKLPDQLDRNGTFLDAEATLSGIQLSEGDIFFLCTDGMSDWILNDSSKSIERLKKVLNLNNQDDFLSLVGEERTSSGEHVRNMENDDITIVIIEINELQKRKLEYEKGYVSNIKELIEKEKKLVESVKNATISITNEGANDNEEIVGQHVSTLNGDKTAGNTESCPNDHNDTNEEIKKKIPRKLKKKIKKVLARGS